MSARVPLLFLPSGGQMNDRMNDPGRLREMAEEEDRLHGMVDAIEEARTEQALIPHETDDGPTEYDNAPPPGWSEVSDTGYTVHDACGLDHGPNDPCPTRTGIDLATGPDMTVVQTIQRTADQADAMRQQAHTTGVPVITTTQRRPSTLLPTEACSVCGQWRCAHLGNEDVPHPVETCPCPECVEYRQVRDNSETEDLDQRIINRAAHLISDHARGLFRGTVTGRFSTSEPAQQTIPRTDEQLRSDARRVGFASLYGRRDHLHPIIQGAAADVGSGLPVGRTDVMYGSADRPAEERAGELARRLADVSRQMSAQGLTITHDEVSVDVPAEGPEAVFRREIMGDFYVSCQFCHSEKRVGTVCANCGEIARHQTNCRCVACANSQERPMPVQERCILCNNTRTVGSRARNGEPICQGCTSRIRGTEAERVAYIAPPEPVRCSLCNREASPSLNVRVTGSGRVLCQACHTATQPAARPASPFVYMAICATPRGACSFTRTFDLAREASNFLSRQRNVCPTCGHMSLTIREELRNGPTSRDRAQERSQRARASVIERARLPAAPTTDIPFESVLDETPAQRDRRILRQSLEHQLRVADVTRAAVDAIRARLAQLDEQDAEEARRLEEAQKAADQKFNPKRRVEIDE